MKHNRRAAVEDLWTKTVRHSDGTTEKQTSTRHGSGRRWRASYVDAIGREHTKAFKIKAQAQCLLHE